LKGFLNAAVTPKDAYEIRVQAQKWSWTFLYTNPDGSTTASTELVLPKDRKIRLVFSSTDVVHSFFIPAFRVKQDVVPSLYTTLWVEPNKTMDTVLECTQYCGKSHSEMLAHVKVVEESEFNAWLEAQNKVDNTPEGGHKLFTDRGCPVCHGPNGEGGQGPKLIGIFGTKVSTNNGEKLVDENYLRDSILLSQKDIVTGFPAGLMPVFQGTMTDKQADAIITWIKSLK
jgi:cytochrome c oxidase subunit 2